MIENPDGITQLEQSEKEGLKHRHVTTRNELNQLEQANIQNGILWVTRTRRRDILSSRFICDLHRHMFGEVWDWAGSFRKTEKNIGIDPIQIPIELKKLIDDTNYWFTEKTYAPRESVIRFHHRLVYIHLFPNGNGRHARVMADTILVKLYRQSPIDWSGGYPLDEMHVQRKKYIHALRRADGGDFQVLLDLLS